MEPVAIPKGYVLGPDRSLQDILDVEADLLRSEGIDPVWPGFADDRKSTDEKS